MDHEQIRAQIIQDLGISSLPEEAQNEIIESLGQNIIRRVTLEILKQIPEDKHEEFDDISQTGDQSQIMAFIETYIPNADEFIQTKTQETIDEFKSLAELA